MGYWILLGVSKVKYLGVEFIMGRVEKIPFKRSSCVEGVILGILGFLESIVDDQFNVVHLWEKSMLWIVSMNFSLIKVWVSSNMSLGESYLLKLE